MLQETKLSSKQSGILSNYPISTHVLDTAKGTPVSNLHVTLYKLKENEWIQINTGVTDSNGRFKNIKSNETFSTGIYKFHFDVRKYYESKNLEHFYPYIEVHGLFD